MGRIVISCYKPKPGKEKELDHLMESHVDRLRKEGLATDRESIIMKSDIGTVVEVFEWKSKEAIEEAHSNQAVQQMWAEFAEVCEFEIPTNVKEFQNLFSEFTPF